ncbi:hypothetical protein AVEN_104516-1 [Araneus ventricosus]|uniref:Uncharacterized protein n=1 Tax=Araneus ventricosus TaxID=182803 RepID=A0A4Y2M6T4_ARAVE|nr:hypothetical protein AVEN_104516-1 [Araneus ventricosus]
MGEISSESSSIMNLPLVDLGLPPLRRTESSIEDCPISDKDTPIEELLGRIATADKKEEGTEAETQFNSSQVLNLPHSLEGTKAHQSVDKPSQNELAASRSQM